MVGEQTPVSFFKTLIMIWLFDGWEITPIWNVSAGSPPDPPLNHSPLTPFLFLFLLYQPTVMISVCVAVGTVAVILATVCYVK